MPSAVYKLVYLVLNSEELERNHALQMMFSKLIPFNCFEIFICLFVFSLSVIGKLSQVNPVSFPMMDLHLYISVLCYFFCSNTCKTKGRGRELNMPQVYFPIAYKINHVIQFINPIFKYLLNSLVL